MTTKSCCLPAALGLAAFAVFASLTGTAIGQTAVKPLPDRIAPIMNSERTPLPGSMPPRAMESTDLGPISATTPLQMSMVFSRSAAQQTDLAQLLAAQQTPGSPQFHQWLTPAQFGARFGVSDNDLATTRSWLESQGFNVTGVSPSRDRIMFSGPESAVQAAFGASLHYFKATAGSMTGALDPATHIAPASNLTLPAALSGVVMAVTNLSDYRPHSYMLKRPVANFTSSQTGNYFLTPKDIATIYDINAAYALGYAGTGQSIVVAGQSEVQLSDITNFQAAAGVTTKTPITTTLIPGTGTATIYNSDEAESDLDLEYSSSIAYNASINFVYTGSSPYYGVFDSFLYAIENDLAPIITVSYGQCEPDLGTAAYNQYEAAFQQANAQGQTVINSAGDSGSSGCYGDGNAIAHQEQLAVSYPASSAYVTGVGGTEFPPADVSSSNSTYFTPAGSGDVISSAKSYIPEQAWNDDAAALSAYQQGLTTAFSPSSGGGGVSILEARPSWQTGVPGIPSGTFRLVPDVALDSSPNNAPYLYCSSDPTVTTSTTNNGFGGATTTTIASCANGFRGSDGATLTAAGGTSFAAPIFAGMLAIINQAKGYNTGQGNVNPAFYTLAANASLSTPASSPTSSTVFHDVTTGTNACNVNPSVCGSGAQTSSYPATAGYDQATGLGSFDLENLIKALPASTSTLIASGISATANTLTPAVGANDAITLQVTGAGATPTGTVAITDNGTTVAASPVALNSGAATYTYSSATAGVHTLVFVYSGDTTYGSSRATVTLNVGNSSFTIAAPAVTVASGSSTTETVTITPVNGYTGTVNLVLGTLSSSTLTNACFTGPNTVTITGSTPTATATYTIYTNTANCPSGAYSLRKLPALTGGKHAALTPAQPGPWRRAPLPVAFGGLLLMVGLRRRKLLRRAAALGVSLALMVTLGLSGLGLTGCSNTSTSNSTTGTTVGATDSVPGTYSFIVQGSDSADPSINTQTTVSLTVTN